MSVQKDILDLFKVMVVANPNRQLFHENIMDGYITDFVPSVQEAQILRKAYKPLDVNVLFTVEERENGDPFQLISKQLLHYLEVYGLGMPGLFNLEVSNGKVVTIVYVRGVTVDELGDVVRQLLYTNAPVKDAEIIKNIISQYNIRFDINKVKNNELRVLLFDIDKHTYNNGDDAVRYLCYRATGSALLIKSPEVIAKMTVYIVSPRFLENHAVVLAQVFNRHKKLILALKNKLTVNIINKISRMSKTMHVPIREGINKRFVSEALKGNIDLVDSNVLDNLSVRDKFKFLNLLEYKKEQLSQDAFVIRNGKVHLEQGRVVFTKENINWVINHIVQSLRHDLNKLETKNILLDKNVHYGLPISRKQTIGNLPFGTTVNVDGDAISSGIYWENAGGARDLDLSTIDVDGNRTGWGQYSGYNRSNPVTFSGDVTHAERGAMEFMTSQVNYDDVYGLFVNIFCGDIPSKMKLVVGTKTNNKWIENPVVREDHALSSRGNVLGFVKDGKFIVYTCRLNGGYVSGGNKNKAIIARGLSNFWTINRLLETLHIKFDLDRDEKKVYDYDLTYSKYTLDVLESML